MTEQKIMERFVRLLGDLSPENLSCDGELSRAQINRKLLLIKKEWKELEKELGKKMTEDDVYCWDEVNRGLN